MRFRSLFQGFREFGRKRNPRFLFFPGDHCFVCQKSRDWRVGVGPRKIVIFGGSGKNRPNRRGSERFWCTQLLAPPAPESHPALTKFRRLFVTCGVITRYFFVAFSWFFRGFFVAFSWPSSV